MVLDQNVFAPEVLANGFGGVDAKRLTRDQSDRRRLQVHPQTEADDIFDAAYLPLNAERTIKQ